MDDDAEMYRLWALVAELSEQLTANRAMTAALQAQIGQLKTQAAGANTGFALRRYNVDISKEKFESELERASAHVVFENQQLVHDNRALSALLKEFEGTLDTVMAKFRSHAYAAQQHETTLVRHYEALLLAREAGDGGAHDAPPSPTALDRLAHFLRAALRAQAGEPDPEASPPAPPAGADPSPSSTASDGASDADAGADADRNGEAPGDWAGEREAEIARLEAENAALRALLRIDAPLDGGGADEAREFGLGMGLAISTMEFPMRARDQLGHGLLGSSGSGSGSNLNASFQPTWRPQQRKAGILGGGPPPVGRGQPMGGGLAPAPQIASAPRPWTNQAREQLTPFDPRGMQRLVQQS